MSFIPPAQYPVLLYFYLKFTWSQLGSQELHFEVCILASLETQGQLVWWKGFSCANVYCKSGRAPGKLLTAPVPEAFEFPAFNWPEKFSEFCTLVRYFAMQLEFTFMTNYCVRRGENTLSPQHRTQSLRFP